MQQSINCLYVGGTNEVYLVGVKRDRDGTPITDATVAWELFDSANASVGDGNGSIVADAAAEDAPLYLCSIGPDVSSLLVAGQVYTLKINVNSGQDLRRLPLAAKYRGAI